MREFLNKIPNWIRYIGAIPIAILSVILFYLFLMIFCLGGLPSDSLLVNIFPFIYGNFINILVFCYVVSYVLPKYKFAITFGICCILLGFISFGMLNLIIIQKCDFNLIILYLLNIVSNIIGCYIAYVEEKTYATEENGKKEFL